MIIHRRTILIILPILTFGILVLIGVISCRLPITIEIKPTPSTRNTWLEEWLGEQNCKPPCFLGITPGKTTITETVRLLSQNSSVQITRSPQVTFDGTDKEMSWDFPTTTPNDGGRIITDKKGEKVLIIDVGLGTDQSLPLSEVISSFGAPSYVFLSDCRGKECVIQLIYLSSGMILESFQPAEIDNSYKHSVDITQYLNVGEIWFFPPGDDGYREAFGFYAVSFTERILEWKGYTTYNEQ